MPGGRYPVKTMAGVAWLSQSATRRQRKRQLWMDNVVANVAVVFAASLLKALSIALLLAFYVSADYPWSHLFTTVWFEAAIAAMFTPFVFSVLDGGRRAWGIE